MLQNLLISLILLYSRTVSSDKCVDAHHDCRLIAVKCLSPNRIEQKLMEIACPLTCGYCIDTRASGLPAVPTVTSSEKTIMPVKCIDEADDCADRINFCNRKFYKRMMSLQCARTCKFCDPDDDYEEEEVGDSREVHLSTLRSKMGEETVQKLEELKIVDNVIELLKNATAASTPDRKPRRFSSKKPANFSAEVTENQEDCVDTASDCERNRKLCTHKAYVSLFRKMCAKTCEYCGLADSTNDLESSGEIL